MSESGFTLDSKEHGLLYIGRLTGGNLSDLWKKCQNPNKVDSDIFTTFLFEMLVEGVIQEGGDENANIIKLGKYTLSKHELNIFADSFLSDNRFLEESYIGVLDHDSESDTAKKIREQKNEILNGFVGPNDKVKYLLDQYFKDMERSMKRIAPMSEVHRMLSKGLPQDKFNTLQGISKLLYVGPSRFGNEIQRTMGIMPNVLQQHSKAENYLNCANRSLGLINSRFNAEWQRLDKVAIPHHTWTESLQLQNNRFAGIQPLVNSALMGISRYNNASTRLNSTFNLEAFSKLSRNMEVIAPRIIIKNENLIKSYISLLESHEAPIDLIQRPSFVLPLASKELFVAGYALRGIISEHIRKQIADESELIDEVTNEVSKLSILLEEVKPKLSAIYVGAKETLNSGNIEKKRHVLASLRELVSHVIREVTPDKDVIAWIPIKAAPYLTNTGRPTRSARLEYLCRFVENDKCLKFIQSDIKAFSMLFDILNEMHAVEPNISDYELELMMIRTESLLYYILNINKLKNQQVF